jgi:ribosome-associated protein
METFQLNSEYIELCQLLKIIIPNHSGGELKHLISKGHVFVDNQCELRKKCKIRAGQIIKYKNIEIKVMPSARNT